MNSQPPAASRNRASKGVRGTWGLRDYPSILWLFLAVVVALMHRQFPESEWLMVHLVLLGALTHAIMVWSTHFTHTLLKTRPELDTRRTQTWRLMLLLIGTSLTVVGLPTGITAITHAGAVLVAAAVVLHGIQIYRCYSASLPGRFQITIRYYLAACLVFPIGIVMGAILATGPTGSWHGRLLLAHTMANLLGWMGLVITGTLLTLWPTMLRTRISPAAQRRATWALPLFIAGLVVILVGAIAGISWVSITGIIIYVAGLLWWGSAVMAPVVRKFPREFAAASVGMSILWFITGVVVVAVQLIKSDGWVGFVANFTIPAAIFAVGVAAQILTGALSYLIPSALGGGKTAVRAGARYFDAWGSARLVLINVGLLVCLLPVPSWVRILVSVAVVAALAAFLPLMVLGLLASVKAKRAGMHTVPEQPDAKPGEPHHLPSIWGASQILASLCALAVLVGLGIAFDPSAVGIGNATASVLNPTGVKPTGEVTTVKVAAKDMRFEPSSIEVPAGNELVIELVNEDDRNVHDLTIAGHTTPRLAPGETATLNLGVVGQSAQGWCTVIGHRQSGMVFDITVTGANSTNSTTSDPAAEGSRSRTPQISPDATIESVTDPVPPPLPQQRVHKMTLTATETELEVAPGITQLAWTFNGQVPGPTLRGRVGDRFELTLVNDGSLGHSIDFHAGAVSPDAPMRTIAPGQSLTYTFTAQHSGVWMYHCGTAPLTTHVGAGMFGAVIIEPEEGFDEVDQEYLIVQSEVYLQAGTGQDGVDAAVVDSAAAAADEPSLTVFNGKAFQYTAAGEPLTAKVGQRVRFFVLPTGPNRSLAFHIVGAQFDTVYREGAFDLGPRSTEGGSQTIGLLASQGGFVETVFQEAGTYTMVNHSFVEAERGAQGKIIVTQ